VSSLIGRFNARTCELRALSTVVPAARARAVGKDLSALGQWARNLSGRMTQLVSELNVLRNYLVRMASGYCSLVEMMPLLDEENRFYEHVMAGLMSLPDAQVGPSSIDYERVRQYIDSTASSYGTVQEYQGSLDSIPMPVRGRGMRASTHFVAPKGVLGWATGQVPIKRGRLLRVDSRGNKSYVRSETAENG